MKYLKKSLTALFVAALLAASPAVLADAPVVAPAELTLAVPAFEDKSIITVTSSVASSGIDSSIFFDLSADTKTLVAPVEGEGQSISIFTAAKEPQIVTKLAAMFAGEKGTALYVNAYGTNDPMLLNWDMLNIATDAETAGDFFTFTVGVEGELRETYTFYRFDFTLESGIGFELAELVLYRDNEAAAAPEDTVEEAEEIEAETETDTEEAELPDPTRGGVKFEKTPQFAPLGRFALSPFISRKK